MTALGEESQKREESRAPSGLVGTWKPLGDDEHTAADIAIITRLSGNVGPVLISWSHISHQE
jgi:hypothetical protein